MSESRIDKLAEKLPEGMLAVWCDAETGAARSVSRFKRQTLGEVALAIGRMKCLVAYLEQTFCEAIDNASERSAFTDAVGNAAAAAIAVKKVVTARVRKKKNKKENK